MSGIFTPGLPAPTVANTGAPLSGSETLPADTNKTSGGYPESIGLTTGSGLLAGIGVLQTVTDSGGTGSGAVLTIDASTGSFWQTTLNGTGRVLNVINMSPGQGLELYATQGSGGSFTITSYQTAQNGTNTQSMKLPGGTLSLSSGSGSLDLVIFRYQATAPWARGIVTTNLR